MLEVKDDTNELEHAKSAESNDSNLRKLNIPDIWADFKGGGAVLLVLTLCQIGCTFRKWPKFWEETHPPLGVGPKVPQYN